ncbi:MAG: hypothetical protein JWO31_447, partial [Phycisphaerales bacterium]|nr:hypothetical protein [Phycisphaerales bacterium]
DAARRGHDMTPEEPTNAFPDAGPTDPNLTRGVGFLRRDVPYVDVDEAVFERLCELT